MKKCTNFEEKKIPTFKNIYSIPSLKKSYESRELYLHNDEYNWRKYGT